ncbi:MAG: type II toxin-antitoxin system VapC family toxin [Hormoscilla sp. SP12CHS1]|nr:type II toxin-antitoxin system VapC family toxin [Hormoscilla sp. SP12CHS1]
MKKLVVDAGPLISFFYAKDPQHNECVAGVNQLQQGKTAIIVPIPIVFEVYKWLLQRVNPSTAQSTLDVMLESFNLVPIGQLELEELQTLVRTFPNWGGSLEDGTVIITARRYRSPVWTINYRDLAAFKDIEF